jgi:transposase
LLHGPLDELDLRQLGFEGVEPSLTGRPSYHPEVMLKIYIYGYLNRIQSSRRLEREAKRNIELMWLTGRLAPDLNDLSLPQGQWQGDPQRLPPVRGALPAS